MHPFFKRVEHIVDNSIVPALLLLFAILVLEFGFHDIAHHYHTVISVAHYLIVAVFIFDLIFKYIRIKPFNKFLKKSWLDILAVFPFSLLFRLFEGLFGLFIAGDKLLLKSQAVLHEAVELEKGAGHFIQEIEKTGKASRTTKLSRIFRILNRTPRLLRLLKAFSFFDRPTPLKKSK